MAAKRTRRVIALVLAMITLSVASNGAVDARVTLHAGSGGTIVYAPRDYSRTEPSVACWEQIQGRYGGNADSGLAPEVLWIYWYQPQLGPYSWSPLSKRLYYTESNALLPLIDVFSTNELTPVGPDEGWGDYEGVITHSVYFSETLTDSFDEEIPQPGDQYLLAPEGDDIVNDVEIVDCRAPIATPQNLTTPYQTALPVSLSGTDPTGDSLTFSVTDPPTHGSVTGTAPNVVYVPAPGYSGPDSFRFTASDGLGPSTPADISINVGAPPSVDRISVTLSGAINYAIDGDSSSTGVTVAKDAFGVASVVGGGQVAKSGGGAASLNFDVHRFFILPIYFGSVAVTDGALSVSTPVLFGATNPTADGAGGTAVWFDLATFPTFLYTMNWSVTDR